MFYRGRMHCTDEEEPNFGRGYGRGHGFGRGHCFGQGFSAYPTKEEEKAFFEDLKKDIEERLIYVNRRLEELGK